MNLVALIGNLASDVEVRDLGEERKLASFLLAVDRGAEGADFVRVTAWDGQAEPCGRFLRKGSRVGVSGRLRSRSWEEEGKRRTAVEVTANRVEFLSKPSAEAPFEPAATAA